MGRRGLIRVAAWLATMVVAGHALAVDPLVGSPPAQRFSPDLDVHPQNYSVAQDRQGIVYMGNQEGVLEFDGETWRLLRLPNQEIVRSITAAPDGGLYVGGYDSFGTLQRDATGQLRFHELADRYRAQVAGRDFADIWEILVAPEGVYFRAVRDVFFWDPAGRRPDAHWHHEGRFGAIARVGDDTLLQFRGEGFKRRTAQGWELLPETAGLVNLVYRLLPLPEGGVLTSGSDGDWWEWRDGALTAATMPPGMPPSSRFENSLRLDDGSLAFGSRDGVVYLVAPDRKSERHFKLAPDFLTDLSPAFDGGFLLPGDDTLYRVAWPTAWSVLGSENGADGSLFALAEWDGRRYLLSSSGAHPAQREAGGSMHFAPDAWEPLTAFDVLGYAPGRALLARAHKLHVVEDGRTRELSPEMVYPRLFRRSRFDATRIFVGTELGLRLVRVEGAQAQLAPPLGTDDPLRVTSLAETRAGEAWVGSERDGIWRYSLAPDGRLVSRERQGAGQGLDYGAIDEGWVERLADGTLVASTRDGWFRHDGTRFRRDSFANLASMRREGELLRIVQAPTGDLWAYGVNRIFHREGDGAWREQTVPGFRRGGLVGHAFEPDGRAVFVGGRSLLLQERRTAPDDAVAPAVLLRAVLLVHPDGRREPLPLNKAARVPTGDYGVRFEFALPDLSEPGVQRYRGRLVGYERVFSEWSRSHGYTYSRLRPGNYRFELEGLDSRGRRSAIAPFQVVVQAPWYATRMARLLAALVALGLLWLLTQWMVRRRTARLGAQKRALEDTVAQRTRELADANHRLEMMAHIDGLTGIPNRRRLDAYLEAVWAQCAERGRPLSVLAIDVDRFKDFNDRHGHQAGDELLRQLVQRLSFCLRRSEDLLARYGGEEFLVVLPGAESAVAAALAEQMRAEVEGAGLGVTVSVGVATRVPDAAASLTDLVAQADAALYLAKKSGRNRVELAPVQVVANPGAT